MPRNLLKPFCRASSRAWGPYLLAKPRRFQVL
jgi:hypothetical protein